jgi:hypothetical protein
MADADDFDRILGQSGLISLALNGTSRPVGIDRLPSGLITVSPGGAAMGYYRVVPATDLSAGVIWSSADFRVSPAFFVFPSIEEAGPRSP